MALPDCHAIFYVECTALKVLAETEYKFRQTAIEAFHRRVET